MKPETYDLKQKNYRLWQQAAENVCLGTDGIVTDEMIEKEFERLLEKEATK